jgi:acetyl esterase
VKPLRPIALLLLALTALVPTRVLAQSPAYTILPAVPYITRTVGPLVADIYIPKGTGPFPGVVFIHGGGWHSGDRTQLRRQAIYMAEHGMVGMAIEYRLAPAHPWPAAIDDSRAAVVWLRQNAAAYHVNPNRIGAVGSSAGGHLVALLGVTGDPKLEAVVVLNGVLDFNAQPPSDSITDLFGHSCAEAPQVCAAASPTNLIRSGAPPFLVMHGDADQSAPYPQAVAFVKKLKGAGGHVEFFTAPAGPHTFWSKPQWAEKSDQLMNDFLQRQLAPR